MALSISAMVPAAVFAVFSAVRMVVALRIRIIFQPARRKRLHCGIRLSRCKAPIIRIGTDKSITFIT